MDRETLKKRIEEFGLRSVRLIGSLPESDSAYFLAEEILCSGAAMAVNYKAACRGESKAEFIARIKIVLEEASKCAYWLGMIIDSGMLSEKKASPLRKEADELTAIFYATLRTSENRES